MFENLLKLKNKKPVPVKHKRPSFYSHISNIQGKHLHQTALVSSVKHGCVRKYFLKAFDGVKALPEIEAFHAELYRLLLGVQHSPKIRVLVGDHSKQYRIRSKEISGFVSFATILQTQQSLPHLSVLLKAGCIEILAACYALGEDDLHAHNWGLDGNYNAIKLDHGRTAYPKIYIFEKCDITNLIEQRNKAQKSFGITRDDLQSFPFINDAHPTNYPLLTNAVEYPIFASIFANTEQYAQIKYRAWKFFIKLSLIYKSIIEQRAALHITSLKKRRDHTNYHYQRFGKISKLLPTLPDFNKFIKNNPQILGAIINELEIYNKQYKAQDAHSRINTERIRKRFYKNYASYLPAVQTIGTLRSEMLQAIISLTKHVDTFQPKLATLNKKVSEFYNAGEHDTIATARIKTIAQCKTQLATYYQNIKQWPQQDFTAPCELTYELQRIKALLEQMDVDFHNLPIINSALKVYRYIELIKRYVDLCQHSELIDAKKRLMACSDAIHKVMVFLNNINTKPTEKLLDYLRVKIKHIESELAGVAFLMQRSRYSTDVLVQRKNDNALNTTIKGIHKFNILPWDILHQKYPGTFFANTKKEAYVHDMIESYEAKIKQLTQQLRNVSLISSENVQLAKWQLRILRYIRKYYLSHQNNISSRRLMDLKAFYKIIITAKDPKQLRKEVTNRAKHIQTGWLFRSELRDCVRKSVLIPKLYRRSP